MKEDFLIRLCNIQFATLDYIEKRSRSANRFVNDKELAKALKISRSAANSRLKRYFSKGWLKEQAVEGERRYLLRLVGLQRLKWLEFMRTDAIPKEFKKKLEEEGIELPDWISDI